MVPPGGQGGGGRWRGEHLLSQSTTCSTLLPTSTSSPVTKCTAVSPTRVTCKAEIVPRLVKLGPYPLESIQEVAAPRAPACRRAAPGRSSVRRPQGRARCPGTPPPTQPPAGAQPSSQDGTSGRTLVCTCAFLPWSSLVLVAGVQETTSASSRLARLSCWQWNIYNSARVTSRPSEIGTFQSTKAGADTNMPRFILQRLVTYRSQG